MKIIKLFLLAICVAVSAVGCASGVKYSEYRPTVSPPAAGMGRIWFYRPSAGGMGVQPGVDLDGQTVGKAKPHGFFYADTTPGEHEVKCTTEWSNKTTVNVTAGQESYIKLRMMIGLLVGHVLPTEVTAAEAEKDLKDMHLIEK